MDLEVHLEEQRQQIFTEDGANLQAESWMHQEHNTGLLPTLNIVPHLQPDGCSLLTSATAFLSPSLSLPLFCLSNISLRVGNS